MRVWLVCDAVNAIVDSINVVRQRNAGLRKQQRAVVTRQKLLRSARAIFARDGFEHARLEDIATNAGRTRGAFYANFRDKEDVFYAIFEEELIHDATKAAPLVTNRSSLKQCAEALGTCLSALIKDRERTLLNLEFKLYVIRHPLRRKRLADLHQRMCLRSAIPEITQVMPKGAKQSEPLRLSNALVMDGIVDGLALNGLFNPKGLNDRELARYLTACLRSTLLQPERG